MPTIDPEQFPSVESGPRMKSTAAALQSVPARASLPQLPELRRLFDAGRRYLHGEASLYQLHARVCHCRVLAKAAGVAPAVLALLDEWARKVERRWSAWTIEARAQVEAEFLAWLRGQLVFDGVAADDRAQSLSA